MRCLWIQLVACAVVALVGACGDSDPGTAEGDVVQADLVTIDGLGGSDQGTDGTDNDRGLGDGENDIAEGDRGQSDRGGSDSPVEGGYHLAASQFSATSGLSVSAGYELTGQLGPIAERSTSTTYTLTGGF